MTQIEFVRQMSRLLRPDLVYVPAGIGSKSGVLFKLLDDLVVILVPEFSRQRITASWYMGVSFLWGYLPTGVGANAYVRVARLLKVAEREHLCGAETTRAEGHDFWWGGVDQRSLAALVRATQLTLDRFIENAPASGLRRSQFYRERRKAVREVCKLVGDASPTLADLSDVSISPWLVAAKQITNYGDGIGGPAAATDLAWDSLLCCAAGLTTGAE